MFYGGPTSFSILPLIFFNGILCHDSNNNLKRSTTFERFQTQSPNPINLVRQSGAVFIQYAMWCGTWFLVHKGLGIC